MNAKDAKFSDRWGARRPTTRVMVVAMSVAVLPLMLGAGTSARAQEALNGLTPFARTLFDAVDGAGGDFIIACPKVGGGLDGTCGAPGADDLLLSAFGDAGGVRFLRDGTRLNRDKVVNGLAFGSIVGTSGHGDVISWAVDDQRSSVQIRANGGTSEDCPSDTIAVQVDNALCNAVAQEIGLPNDSLAYLFAAATVDLNSPATVTLCSGFTAQCNFDFTALPGVTVASTRPIFAYDGDPYASYLKWK